jgi:CRP/FNR family transcriptional regulator
MKDLDFLKINTFLAGLPEADLEKIANISTEHFYGRNSMVFMEGDPGEAFYYIKSGKVKIFRSYEDGKEHIVHILDKGGVFGEATLFTGIPYPASASVYEDTVLVSIKNCDLEKLLAEIPELSLRLIRLLSSKLAEAQQKIRELTFNDVYTRTASMLLKLAADHGKAAGNGTVIDLKLSRQDLAEMAGTVRETISRVIGRFKKDGAIAEHEDKIVVLNAQLLKAWL